MRELVLTRTLTFYSDIIPYLDARGNFRTSKFIETFLFIRTLGKFLLTQLLRLPFEECCFILRVKNLFRVETLFHKYLSIFSSARG